MNSEGFSGNVKTRGNHNKVNDQSSRNEKRDEIKNIDCVARDPDETLAMKSLFRFRDIKRRR